MDAIETSRVGWFSRLKAALDFLATAGIIVLAGSATWNTLGHRIPSSEQHAPANRVRVRSPIPAASISIGDAATLGDASAPIAVVEYSDFQCPFCARFAELTLPKLREKYIDRGAILMVFEHFPLSSIHSSALKAAEAADCANDEGKFWAMHDALFKNQKTLDTLDPIALSAGLDMNTFRECLKRDQRAKVDAEVSSASRLGVSATPTFFVGRKERSGQIKVETVLQGMQTFDDLDAVISNLPSGSEQQK